MPKHKSPGQKRKKIVRIITFLIFIAATYAGSLLHGFVNTASLKWVENHKEVVATITELTEEEEEYRNLKGRKRYRTNYYITYSFKLDGYDYSNTIEVSESVYSSKQKGGKIDVYYASDEPELNEAKINVESELASNNTVENMIGVLPFTAPAGLLLYWILKLIFVRESKKSLPTGFYTETSWLDIDDNYVVVLDNNDLVYFGINDKQSGEVQEAYQNNASLEELIALSKGANFKRIPLADITELKSDHNSDVIRIEHDDDYHSVEFLNQTVKAHALERIKKFIPASLSYEKKEKTRIQAAIPATIMLAILVAIIFALDIFVINLIIGFIAVVWVIPKIFSRLIDPTITEKWFKPETES